MGTWLKISKIFQKSLSQFSFAIFIKFWKIDFFDFKFLQWISTKIINRSYIYGILNINLKKSFKYIVKKKVYIIHNSKCFEVLFKKKKNPLIIGLKTVKCVHNIILYYTLKLCLES